MHFHFFFFLCCPQKFSSNTLKVRMGSNIFRMYNRANARGISLKIHSKYLFVPFKSNKNYVDLIIPPDLYDSVILTIPKMPFRIVRNLHLCWQKCPIGPTGSDLIYLKVFFNVKSTDRSTTPSRVISNIFISI